MLENFLLLDKTTTIKGNVMSVVSNGCVQIGNQILMGASHRSPHLKVGDETIPFEFHKNDSDILIFPVMNKQLIFKRVKTDNRYVLKSAEDSQIHNLLEKEEDREIVKNTGILRFISTTSHPVYLSEEKSINCFSSSANNYHSDYLFIFGAEASCLIRHENTQLKVSYKKEFLIEKQ